MATERTHSRQRNLPGYKSVSISGGISGSRGTSPFHSPDAKSLPYKKMSSNHHHFNHHQQQQQQQQQRRHDTTGSNSMKEQQFYHTDQPSSLQHHGLMSHEAAMSLRWQLLVSHQQKHQHQQQHQRLQQHHQQQQQQQQHLPQQQEDQHPHQPQPQLQNRHFKFSLAMALSTTAAFASLAPKATGNTSHPQFAQHDLPQHQQHQQSLYAPHSSVVSLSESTNGHPFQSQHEQGPQFATNTAAGPMDTSMSSLSSHSSCGSVLGPFVPVAPLQSPPPLRRHHVSFAETNTVWYRTATTDDLQQSWYSDADYKAFEADNRHIVATVWHAHTQKQRNRSDSTASPVTATARDESLIDSEHCDSICGLEHYMEGRKPMMKRKLSILQHSAMVLEMYDEQKRNNQSCPSRQTGSTGTWSAALGNGEMSPTTSSDRLWMDPELIRKVSLRFSKEPLQRALTRAARIAIATSS